MDPTAPGRGMRKTVRYDLPAQTWRQGSSPPIMPDADWPLRSTSESTSMWDPKALQLQVRRIWRISVFALCLLLLATAVHIVQLFVPPAQFCQRAAAAGLTPPPGAPPATASRQQLEQGKYQASMEWKNPPTPLTPPRYDSQPSRRSLHGCHRGHVERGAVCCRHAS